MPGVHRLAQKWPQLRHPQRNWKINQKALLLFTCLSGREKGSKAKAEAMAVSGAHHSHLCGRWLGLG
jgi:hypothetical protein